MSAFQAVRRGFDSHRPLQYSTGSVVHNGHKSLLWRGRGGGVLITLVTRALKRGCILVPVDTIFRGISSVDRAVALQASGRRFDPDILHH